MTAILSVKSNSIQNLNILYGQMKESKSTKEDSIVDIPELSTKEVGEILLARAYDRIENTDTFICTGHSLFKLIDSDTISELTYPELIQYTDLDLVETIFETIQSSLNSLIENKNVDLHPSFIEYVQMNSDIHKNALAVTPLTIYIDTVLSNMSKMFYVIPDKNKTFVEKELVSSSALQKMFKQSNPYDYFISFEELLLEIDGKLNPF